MVKATRIDRRNARLPALRVAIAVAVLYLVLAVPVAPGGDGVWAFVTLPLALPLLILLTAIGTGRARRATVILAVVLVCAIAVLKIADALTHLVFARPFNAYMHLSLVADGVRFLQSALGTVGAAGVVIATVALLVGGGYLLFRTVRMLNEPGRPRSRALSLGFGAALIATWGVAAAADVHIGVRPLAEDRVFTTAWERILEHRATARDVPIFRTLLGKDPYAHVAPGRRLAALRGNDVVVLFIESYGRATVESPLFAPHIGPRLDTMAKRLAAAGVTTASGWMDSATYGGQSWLAHSTLLSGVRVDRQTRYAALQGSHRATLARDFGTAGWRTVLMAPAIVRPWPEAGFYGFDRIYTAPDLGYRGLARHYMTMPDQFTLSELARRELVPRRDRNVFAMVALTSSHAPWTPIPVLKPWDAIGDGRTFDAAAFTGAPPETVWSSPGTIRAAYAESIAYVLAAIESFVIEKAGPKTLVIIVGDHQPFPYVSGNAPTRDVPVHVLARDGGPVRALAAGWLSPGLRPAAGAPSLPMEDFRGRLIETFSPGARRPAGTTAGSLGQ